MTTPTQLITPALISLLVAGCFNSAGMQPLDSNDTDDAADGSTDDGADDGADDDAADDDAADDDASDDDASDDDAADDDAADDDAADDDGTDDDADGDGTDGGTDDGPMVEPCETANPPSLLVIEGRAFPRTAPEAQWATPLQGCSDTVEYEVAIGTSAGADDVMAFTSFGGASQWDGTVEDGVRLPDSIELFTSVRAVDAEGNVSEPVSQSFTIWSPVELPALSMWIDFGDENTVFGDVDCSVGANDGDSIGCVLDKSGNDNHFLAMEDFEGPVMTMDAHAGLAAADFFGTRALRADSSDTLSPDGTGMTVVAVDAPQGVDSLGAGTIRYLLQKEDAYEFAYFSNNLFVAINTIVPGSWGWAAPETETAAELQCNVFTHDDDMWSFRRNGEDLGQVSPGAGQTGAIVPTAAPVYLGGRFDGGNTSLSYDSQQGELVMTAGVLGEEDLASIERYMLEKWGL